jgi:pyruvate carboxylase
MGDKVIARQKAIEAGIEVVPGTDTSVSFDEAYEFCGKNGYPVILKSAEQTDLFHL